jgi:hypothetical protein
MLRTWLDRLQVLWVQNTRNRIVIMVSTAVLAILLLCGCLNLLGVLGGGLVNSLFASAAVTPTIQTGTQVANINPTFPLPTPTVNPPPPCGNAVCGSGTPVPASGTPPPTATPTPSSTPGAGAVTFHISPTDGALTAGQTNVFTLSGPPNTLILFSLQFQGSPCGNQPLVLDGGGQGMVSCAIPTTLKGNHTLNLFYNGQDHQYQLQVMGG